MFYSGVIFKVDLLFWPKFVQNGVKTFTGEMWSLITEKN